MRKFYAMVGVMAVLWSGCSTDDNLEDDQRTAFKTYLSGQQIPYTEQSGVYKYVSNTDRADYPTAAVLEAGGEAEINFAIYEFKSSGTGALYYTNQPELVADTPGLDWPLVPEKINLGASDLVKGVRLGLPGCREGDSVQLYLVSALGYGNKPLGLVPAKTPLVWKIVVNKVVK